MDSKDRLYRARIERGIDPGRIAALTALSPSIVRKIDEGRFEELPGGLYARSYVRAFAEAVGLNPEDAVKEVEAWLPGAPDPLPALRDLAQPSPLESLRTFLASQAGPLTTWLNPRAYLAGARADARETRDHVGVSAALMAHCRKVAAAMIDTSALIAIGVAEALSIAWICGIGVTTLLVDAGAALAALFLVPVALYFLLFEGIGGRTPGAALCGVPAARPARELRLRIVTNRSARAASSAA